MIFGRYLGAVGAFDREIDLDFARSLAAVKPPDLVGDCLAGGLDC